MYAKTFKLEKNDYRMLINGDIRQFEIKIHHKQEFFFTSTFKEVKL